MVMLCAGACARFSAPADWNSGGAPPPLPPPMVLSQQGASTDPEPPSSEQIAIVAEASPHPLATGVAVPATAVPVQTPLRFQEQMPAAMLAPSAPAVRYANLSSPQCVKALLSAELPFRRVGGVRGVATAMRFSGPIGAVLARAPGGKSPYGILDCRLALVMAELAKVLEAHGVVAMRIDNMYRPNSRFGSSRKRSQHAYGLAVDIFSLTFADGETLEVQDAWVPKIGQVVCGPEASSAGLKAAEIRLRNIVCDVARAGLFHHLLTPNFNNAHSNHFHFDIKRGDKSYSVS